MFTAFHHGIHFTGETHFNECASQRGSPSFIILLYNVVYVNLCAIRKATELLSSKLARGRVKERHATFTASLFIYAAFAAYIKKAGHLPNKFGVSRFFRCAWLSLTRIVPFQAIDFSMEFGSRGFFLLFPAAQEQFLDAVTHHASEDAPKIRNL